MALAVGLLGASTTEAQLKTAVRSAYRDHPWAMKHSDEARTGQSTYVGATNGTLRWQRFIGGPVPEIVVSADGTIIVGDVYHGRWWDQYDYVTALTSSGTILWRVEVPSYRTGGGVRGGPALDRAGNVVLPISGAKLAKISKDGELEWTFLDNTSGVNDSSPVVFPDGSSIHNHPTGSGLYRLAPDGSVDWLTSGTFSQSSSVAVAANGEIALGGIRSGEPHDSPFLHYFDADGRHRWTLESAFGNFVDPMIGPDGTIFLSRGALFAFNTDGTVKWQKAYSSGVTPALGKNGQLYTTSFSELYALRPNDGSLLWNVTLAGQIGGLAIDARDVVYARTSNGYIAAIDSGGTILWQLQVCEEMTQGPVVGPNQTVVASGTIGYDEFGQDKNYVFCIQ